MNEPCGYLTYRRVGFNPDEFCNEPSVPGTDRCEDHTDLDHPEAHEL